jgi:uncharacterized protein YndB with AHSA1/START domain
MLARFQTEVVFLFIGFCLIGCDSVTTVDDPLSAPEGPSSEVVGTDAGELILIQEILISAAVDDVWKAYTTSEGWTGWAAPKAEIDLRVGGTIRTAYVGEIGGENTNTLQIVNYVPRRLLTLRADVSDNWPEIMKRDAERLSNVVLFESTGPNATQIQSFGIGYTDSPELEQLMTFFIKANEGLLENLKVYLESGTRTEWSE